MKYDVLIVGASNDNLLMALELLSKGKTILIIDSLKKSIELENNYIQGHFEFSDNYEYLYGEKIKKLLNYYEITKEEEYEDYSYNTNLVTYQENYQYKITSSAEEFIEQVRINFPNVKNLDKLFNYAKQCFEATNLILENQPVKKDLYPLFYKFKDMPYKTVLDKLHINRSVQNLLEVLTEIPFNIPFNDFATTLYATIIERKYKLNKSNAYLYYRLRKQLENLGCIIKYDTKILEINTKNNKITGATLNNGITIECDNIVYGKLPSTILPILKSSLCKKNDYQKINNTQKLKVFFGMMKPLESMSLKNGKYIIKSDDNKDITNINQTIYLENYSDRSIITLECNYQNNCWNDYVNKENYYYNVTKLVNELMGCFEDLTKKDLKEYIEEIKIVTPIDYAYKYENVDGQIFEELTYELKNRLLKIEGLYITNLYLEYDYLFNSHYLINLMIAKRIIGEN